MFLSGFTKALKFACASKRVIKSIGPGRGQRLLRFLKPFHKKSLYQVLFNQMNEGFGLLEVVSDEEGRPQDYLFLEVNSAFERLTGLKRDDVIGKTQTEIFTTNEKHWINAFGIVALTGEPLHFEEYSAYLEKYFEVFAFCPEPGKVAVLFLDITERRRREEELERLNRTQKALSSSAQVMLHAESEDQYLREVCRIIVEDCGHAMVWVGFAEDDKQKTVRPVAYNGFDQGYIEGLNISWDAQNERGRGPTGTAIREGRVMVCDDMLKDPRMAPWLEQARKHRFASSIALPLMEGAKAFGALTIYSKEVSHFSGPEVKLLTQLANDFAYGICALRLKEEHARTVVALQKAKEAAEAANKAKDDFLAVLSHELRTPLTPILAAAQIMQNSVDLDAGMKEIAGVIRRNIELEARLIDDLLDLTRITRGKLELHLRPTDLHNIISNVVEMCAPCVKEKEIRLKLDLLAKERLVNVDPARLQQVLWNLITNAVKFTPLGGSVTVRTINSCAGKVELEVQDSGVGIEPEVLPKLFSAFEQGGRRVTRQFGGLGLGLAISKSLAEMQGGSLSVKSEGKGKGARFKLELACHARPQTEKKHVLAPGIERLPRSAASILLVEDNIDTALMMATLFKQNGYDVTIAGSIKEALKGVRTSSFDLVISDLGLPDGSGYELMEQIHASVPTPGIAVSGFGMEDDVQKSLRAGFLEHITKPVDFCELERAVKRILTNAAADTSNVKGKSPVNIERV